MPHLVRYRTNDGNEADHEVDELGEAIAHVERLRNEDGVEGARIFRIEEVAFEFKPYFRVEIGTTAPAMTMAPAPRPAVALMATADPAPEPETAPVWAPAAEVALEADGDAEAASEVERTPAHLVGDGTITVDPWADAPPPPSPDEAVTSGSGRRGLFGR